MTWNKELKTTIDDNTNDRLVEISKEIGVTKTTLIRMAIMQFMQGHTTTASVELPAESRDWKWYPATIAGIELNENSDGYYVMVILDADRKKGRTRPPVHVCRIAGRWLEENGPLVRFLGQLGHTDFTRGVNLAQFIGRPVEVLLGNGGDVLRFRRIDGTVDVDVEDKVNQ